MESWKLIKDDKNHRVLSCRVSTSIRWSYTLLDCGERTQNCYLSPEKHLCHCSHWAGSAADVCTVRVAGDTQRGIQTWTDGEGLLPGPKVCPSCTRSPEVWGLLCSEKVKAGRSEHGKEVKYEGARRTHYIKVNQLCTGQCWRQNPPDWAGPCN